LKTEQQEQRANFAPEEGINHKKNKLFSKEGMKKGKYLRELLHDLNAYTGKKFQFQASNLNEAREY
jgi:hypothetical protein